MSLLSSPGRWLAAAASASVLLGSPAAAQSPGIPDSIRTLLQEYQEVQARIETVQDRALEANPELQTRQQEIEEAMTRAMVAHDPSIVAKMQRLQELAGELEAAEAGGDTAAAARLLAEGRQIRLEIEAAQAAALEEDTIARQVAAFEDDLVDRMREIEPEIDRLFQRFDALAARIRAATPGPGG